MDSSASSPVEATHAPVAAVHQAIRRGSVLRSVAPPPPSDALARAYLSEQAEEAEHLTDNARLLHQLREEEEEAQHLPPPPPLEEDDGDVPPPPSTAPPAAFLIALNPRLKLGLSPVASTKAQHDGLNPQMVALQQIEKRDLRAGLRSVVPPPERNFVTTREYSNEAREELAELNQALRRNSVIMTQLQMSGPPPAYPESAEDLAEAAEAKEAEEALALESIPEDASTTSLPNAAAARAAHARKNSRVNLLGDLSKPSTRLRLTPVLDPVVASAIPAVSSNRADELSAFCRRPASATLMIGLMSGTSLDGVDAALVDFASSGVGPGKVIRHHFTPMPPALRQTLLQLNTPSNGGEGELHRAALAANELSELYATSVSALLAASGVPASRVLAIANHGQTIRHKPELGYTLQIGNHALLAERTGLPVVADFRSRDVAAGGTGAPLVPAFHQAFFFGVRGDGEPATAGVVLNLGGIANISYIRGSGDSSSTGVIGFDTGPANVLSDLWIKKHKGVEYDADGTWAASGRVLPTLLERMLSDGYFATPPPKSTGRDLFNDAWLQAHVEAEIKASSAALRSEDVSATIVELTAVSVARAIDKYCVPTATGGDSGSSSEPVYICGGGASNSHLMARLRFHLPSREVSTTPAHVLAPDCVEACAFAWLGWQFLRGRTANLPQVTGAQGPRILGSYYPA